MNNLDTNATDIIAQLNGEGINYLYHFTSIENLPGISRHNALCSKAFLESCNEWPCPKPGGNTDSHSLDRQLDNWNKIALSLTPQIQMGYHKKRQLHLCFFLISTEVAGWKDVIFTDTNSASPNHQRGISLEGLELINFDMVRIPFKSNDRFWHTYHQAEVLVPDRIPLEFVSQVAFVSDASMKLGERLWGQNPHPHFVVNIPIFEDIPNPSNPTINYPHVSSIRLSDQTVNRSNYRNVITHVTHFHRKETSTLTAVITLYALAGTKGNIIWSTNGVETEYEFRISGGRTWWPHINLEDIPNGPGELEVRLDKILWATSEYEVIP